MRKSDGSHTSSNSLRECSGPIDRARRSMRLARRELLVTAVAAVLAGCGQALGLRPVATPTPTPPFVLGRTGTLYIDGTVSSALGKAVMQSLGGVAGIADVTAVPSLSPAPDFILTFGQLPSGYSRVSISSSPLTAITHLRVPVDDITAD